MHRHTNCFSVTIKQLAFVHMKLHRRHSLHIYVFVLDAQGPRPGALNRIHDGLDHFRGGALASQVSSVQLEKEMKRREEKTM